MLDAVCAFRVSSPHRYCQNPIRRTSATPTGSWFQALIGTAKTRRLPERLAVRVLVSSPHRYCQNARRIAMEHRRNQFQALIGTAKTTVRTPSYHAARQFQALIGTAKTRELRTVLSHLPVSSPHRYCQNSRPLPRRPADCTVSSPHRYCQNACAGSRCGRTSRGFKPS